MTNATTIKILVNNDPTATPQQKQAILSALKGTDQTRKPKLINRRQAADILDCSTKTIDRYVQRGLIRQIKFTERRIRFDERAIIRFAREGVAQ
jgi:hypothetical protein